VFYYRAHLGLVLNVILVSQIDQPVCIVEYLEVLRGDSPRAMMMGDDLTNLIDFVWSKAKAG